MTPPIELAQQIEDLALRLVVGDASSAGDESIWLPALQKIQRYAASLSAQPVVDAAQAVINAVAAGESGPIVLQEGIANLQKALEQQQPPAVPAAAPLAQDQELLSDFLVESREHLAAIETQALALERDPCDSEALNAAFRGFHTIKGLAGFLELWDVQKLAHEVEAVLDRARNSQLTITPDAIDIVLESADYLRRWLAHLESRLQQHPSSPPGNGRNLLEAIHRLLKSEPDATPGEAAARDQTEAEKSAAPPALPAAAESQPAAASPAPTAEARRSEVMAVKVDTAKLDYLVDMAGEMVIAESLVRHDADLAKVGSPLLQRKIAHLTRITAELQKTAMAMRLVPIGPLFRRMARLVRDLSRQFGKQVEMETQGDDIELDRTIVEELADPLMHMVRNALDHGIEAPPDRKSAGKATTARLLLRAQHRAGQVVIEIADDGRGLDRAAITAKAMQRGLISSADGLSDSDVYNLIFEPGFTTAAQVTNVSGRGVGMDVVRRHIEKLRGRIEIRSTPGQGATFLLKLPLTLAIIDGLVVAVGQERYIIPLFAVREMFRPKPETIWTVQQRAEMALVRGSLLPVVRLYRTFRVEPHSQDALQSMLVVAEVEGQRFCVLVDALIGKQEVVIKALGETFNRVQGIAGGAILGDGRVGLILDLERIFKEKAGEAGY
ncbi:MAG TPA: chemotaxis protein CheA [Candidatus Acidoferrales bacterium]|nr:chemotaxis protein CheA [Candidatus Acidoferrales bacterium]